MTDRRQGGFTLTEVLIVVVIMGVLATAIAIAFSVIVRTVPPTEARADDARSLLGVTTWLPADVSAVPQVPRASAAPNWDDDPVTLSGCGTDPGANIVRLSWRESLSGSPVTFVASYQLVGDNDTTRIVRVACRLGGPADVLNVTADLPGISQDPVDLAWKTEVRDGVEYIVGLELEVMTLRNELVRVDASSRNPDQTLGTIPEAVTTTSTTTLPPVTTTTTTIAATTTTTTTDPAATTTTTVNGAPTAGPISVTLQRDASPFNVSLPASDPNGDELTVTFPVLPTGWSATVSGLDVEFSAADPAAGPYVFDYVVTDPGSLSAQSTISFDLTPVPCSASIVAIAPNPVGRTGKGNPAYPLVSPVDVDITSSGDCGNLILRYTPTTAMRTQTFGGSVRLTIPGGPSAESWNSGSQPLELVLDGNVLHTRILQVLKN